MGTVLTNFGEMSLIAGWLGGESAVLLPVGAGSGAKTIVPTAQTGDWGVGLGVNGPTLGTTPFGTNKAVTIADIVETGGATGAGYARRPLKRDDASTGWPMPTATAQLVSGSYQTTAPEVVFGPFTGPPTPQTAAFWFVAGSTVKSDNNVLFGADLAAVRTFTTGSTERVTATFRVV